MVLQKLPTRISVRFNDSRALQLLIAGPVLWKHEEPARAPVEGGTEDRRWWAASSESYSREEELVRQLAEEFRIRYRPHTRQFWQTLAGVLLGLFPASQVRRETRGRKRKADLSEVDLQAAADAAPKERKQIIGAIADRYKVPDSTVSRALRRARAAKTGR
jgi:hypothetical protein